jgi:protein phosphatase 2C family protein 2/3
MLVLNDVCYVANVGDSRAVLSADSGVKVCPLTRDHKPNDERERARIIEAGGEVYQSKVPGTAALGVYRVSPGRLSVCRSFGDIEAKDERYGGNHQVLIAVPDIRAFNIADNFDFVLLASDGVFDRLSNKDAVSAVWGTLRSPSHDFHKQCGLGTDAVLTLTSELWETATEAEVDAELDS